MSHSLNERRLVETSANLLIRRFHRDLSLEKAKDIIEKNRSTGKPMLYAGANYDMADFLATGCRKGVFIDKAYSDTFYPGGISTKYGYLEDFGCSLFRLVSPGDISNLSLTEEGDIKRGGKWIVGFSYCGEEKKVICYGKNIRRLATGELEAEELKDGLAHYATVHYPTEWSGIFIAPSILDMIVPGGYLETWFNENEKSPSTEMGFQVIHKNNASPEERFGRSSTNGISIYDRLGDYVILERKPNLA